MPKWQVLTETALFLMIALLVLVTMGATVPLFRTLLAAAVALLAVGVLWRGWQLLAVPAHGSGVDRKLSAVTGAQGKDGRGPAPPGGYRLLVTDIDGTLIGPAQAISPRVRRAIDAAQARGIRVVLCTGRSPAATRRFIDELQLEAPQIFFDGALVSLPGVAADIFCCAVDPLALRELVARCREAAIPLELCGREGYFIMRQTAESEWHSRIQGVRAEVADFDRLLEEERIIKAELISADPKTRAAIAAMAPHFGGALRFSWAKVPGFDNYDLVNVVHPTVSKGEALRHLAVSLGVPTSAVVAVGDGPNDIPLLEAAGLGVAMGNAPAAVKLAAAETTVCVEEDGLALAIERFLLT